MTDPAERQRLDKWLWFARVVKTRPLAQDLAAAGRVRINGRKVTSAAQPVRIGDVLTIGLSGRVRVLRITAFAQRRGSYPQALLLFEDLAADAARPPPDEDGEDGEA